MLDAGHLLSPSPTPHVFTRWSTSRLNSGGTSASTSPCGSTRSSFNYRQPYLGWRSQERLARPRTPAERLAVGLLPAQQQQHQIASPQNIITPQQELQQILQQEVELEQLQREDEEQVLKKFVWWNVTISCDMDMFVVSLILKPERKWLMCSSYSVTMVYHLWLAFTGKMYSHSHGKIVLCTVFNRFLF